MYLCEVKLGFWIKGWKGNDDEKCEGLCFWVGFDLLLGKGFVSDFVCNLQSLPFSHVIA